MEKWPKSFFSAFQEKQNLDVLLSEWILKNKQTNKQKTNKKTKQKQQKQTHTKKQQQETKQKTNKQVFHWTLNLLCNLILW